MTARHCVLAFALPTFALIAAAGCHSAPAASGAPSPADSRATAAPAVAAAPSRPAGVTDEMIRQGEATFAAGSCVKCHGDAGRGGANGPSLVRGSWLHVNGDYDSIVGLITRGVTKDEIKDPSHRFNMRPRGGMQPLLTDDQVKAVAAYVWSISREK